MATKAAIIEERVRQELSEHGFTNPTDEQLLEAYLGLRDGWKEDRETSLEKTYWQITLQLMINNLMIKIGIRDLLN